MAEETLETLNVVETEVTEQVDTQAEVETPQEKTYTESEMQKIIKDRVSREQKAREKAVEEASRLAKMNEDEKAKYELEQANKRIQEYERKDAFYGLSREASKMLSEKDIIASDDLLAFVVKDTAEDTQSAVNSFVALIDAKVAEGVKKALSGTAPKVNVTNNTDTTKEQFSKMGYKERLELSKNNPALYNKLK